MAKAIFSTWNDKVLDGRYNGTTYSAEEVGLPLTYGEDKEFNHALYSIANIISK